MLKHSVILFIGLIFSCNLLAQKRFNAERKYAILLPERWNASPKLLSKITNIVTAFVPELTDKQECLNCEANYWIKFYVASVQTDEIYYRNITNEFITNYRFIGFMDVYNIEGYLLRRLYLNTKQNVYNLNTKVLNFEVQNENKNFPFDPENYIRKYQQKLVPTTMQLWDQLEAIVKDVKITSN